MSAESKVAQTAEPRKQRKASKARKMTTILDLIGNTPMVELGNLSGGVAPGVSVYAKLEGFNPSGSVKARAAWNMVKRGIEAGQLTPGKIILDSTSGNTGIALAMIGAVLGYPVTLVMPENVSQERKRVLAAYGAKIIYSDGLEGSDGAILECRSIYAKNPDIYFKPDQYGNSANPEAHYLTTGPEIWEQTQGRITHFLATIGTSGTLMGTGRYLHEKNPDVSVVAVEPDDAFHGIEGLKHMGSSIIPEIYDPAGFDVKVGVSTDDAYEMVYQLAAREGLLCGQSSGAAVVAALNIAAKLDHGCVVAILPDFGDRYLSTNLWIGWRDRHEILAQQAGKG